MSACEKFAADLCVAASHEAPPEVQAVIVIVIAGDGVCGSAVGRSRPGAAPLGASGLYEVSRVACEAVHKRVNQARPQKTGGVS